jgi:hypothetical protein
MSDRLSALFIVCMVLFIVGLFIGSIIFLSPRSEPSSTVAPHSAIYNITGQTQTNGWPPETLGCTEVVVTIPNFVNISLAVPYEVAALEVTLNTIPTTTGPNDSVLQTIYQWNGFYTVNMSVSHIYLMSSLWAFCYYALPIENITTMVPYANAVISWNSDGPL